MNDVHKLENQINLGIHTKETGELLVKILNEYELKSEELYSSGDILALAELENEYMKLFMDYLKEFKFGKNSEIIRALEYIQTVREFIIYKG